VAPQSVAEEVLAREAALLDAEEWDGWLALMAPDVRYWVPLDPAAEAPEDGPSLFDEDRLLLEMRCRRFRHARAWGREGGRRTLHQVSCIVATAEGEGVVARSQLVVHEHHRDRLTLFPGRQLHRLVRIDGAWRIRRKEIRLVNATGVFDPIEIIL
jgi:3-phenylpropionate/cinnamic acid dioxygenase small subunit